MNISRFLAFRFKSLRGLTIVHVGAHKGQEAKQYERQNAAHVIWVEASPITFLELQENIAKIEDGREKTARRASPGNMTRHSCLNALISDSDGAEVPFFNYIGGQASSVFQINQEIKEYQFLKESGAPTVLPTSTLDSALESAGLDVSAVNVLVLDTQGSELLCLKGARRLLSSVRYIEAEVSTKAIYKDGVLLPELDQWLRQEGFVRKTWVRRAHMNAIYERKAS